MLHPSIRLQCHLFCCVWVVSPVIFLWSPLEVDSSCIVVLCLYGHIPSGHKKLAGAQMSAWSLALTRSVDPCRIMIWKFEHAHYFSVLLAMLDLVVCYKCKAASVKLFIISYGDKQDRICGLIFLQFSLWVAWNQSWTALHFIYCQIWKPCRTIINKKRNWNVTPVFPHLRVLFKKKKMQ